MEAKELLDSVKSYGRIEYEGEDDLLLGLLEAAMETLERSGVPKGKDTPLYRLAVQRLAMHYYENREEVGGGQPVPMGLNWMIEQLRYDDADEE